jgi:hypothetical protein
MRRRTIGLGLALVLAAPTFAPSALAETRTVGADLSRPANSTLDCTVLPGFLGLPSGVGTCTWWSMQTFAATNESLLAPYPGGVVRRVRVKTGPVTGPMRVDVIRLRREASFVGEAACCFATGVSSQVFTPAAGAVTTLDVNLPVRHALDATTNTWDFDTLALTVLAPGVPVPMHDTGQQSYSGPASAALYPYFDQAVEQRTLPHAVPGRQVLMSADVELTGAPATPPPPPTAPAIPGAEPARLAATVARVARGAARVPLVCGPGGRCVGTLSLQSRPLGGVAGVRTAAARRTQTYAVGPIRLAAGRRGVVSARLTAHGRRLLRARTRATVYANLVLGAKRVAGGRIRLTR